MAFTTYEKEMRHRAIQNILEANRFQALLLIGDTNVGYSFYGDFRYYTNNETIFHRQAAVIFPQSEPVLFAGTEVQRGAASRRSFVNDCRLIGRNLAADIANLLKERRISSGRIGVNMEMLPVAWYAYLKQELPQIEWVETHHQIMQIRLNRSKEEGEAYIKGAALGDGSFEAALKIIRPGVSEYEVVAAIEHFCRARGAEGHFTLIASGKFAYGEENTLPLPCAPSHRQIELGDSVVMEITPRCDGYWTQLVRTVNVGKANSDLEEIQRVCCNAINEGLKTLEPGKTVKDIVTEMESYVADCGYVLKPPIGHICGVDLVEARVSKDTDMALEPGTAVIIHPTVLTPDGKNSFFWGETYLVTSDGYERLHRSSSQLLTL